MKKVALALIATVMLGVIGCSTVCSIPGISSLGVCSASPSASPTP